MIVALLCPLTVYALSTSTVTNTDSQSSTQIVDARKSIEILQLLQPEASIVEQIREAAIKNGVDPSLALNIACAESNFRVSAKNPSSTAGGVYQWLDSSWHYNVVRFWGSNAQMNKFDATDNITLSIMVLKTIGSSDWNESKYSGLGGGWANRPFERGLCNYSLK